MNEPVKKFIFQDRAHCLCGEPLKDDARTVCKKYDWGEVTFRRCQRCLSWVQSPEITIQSAAEWYDSVEYREGGGGYLDYFADEPHRQVEAESRYDLHIKDVIRIESPDVLEVGCATGSMLSVLKRHGYNVLGLDLSSAFVEWGAKTNQVEIRIGDYLESGLFPTSFDLIIMLGTVSNMHDIVNVLKKTSELLKPGGVFYFNFPMATSFTARIYNKQYWMFAPSVLNFMSDKGCRIALQNAGFRVVRMMHDRQRPSLSKLLGHAGMAGIYRYLKKKGMGDRAVPISIPIPGVMVVIAEKG